MIKKHWKQNDNTADIEAIRKSLGGGEVKPTPQPVKEIDRLDQLRMRTQAIRERLYNAIRDRH
jgi:hypothetical protein